jgi:hypothetical protein
LDSYDDQYEVVPGLGTGTGGAEHVDGVSSLVSLDAGDAGSGVDGDSVPGQLLVDEVAELGIRSERVSAGQPACEQGAAVEQSARHSSRAVVRMGAPGRIRTYASASGAPENGPGKSPNIDVSAGQDIQQLVHNGT